MGNDRYFAIALFLVCFAVVAAGFVHAEGFGIRALAHAVLGN